MAGRAKDNARRYGVRAAPSSDDVGAHLTRILGRAPLPGELEAPTPRLAAALRLADCEARLDRAHAHYAAAQPRDRALEDYLGLGGATFPKQAKNRA